VCRRLARRLPLLILTAVLAATAAGPALTTDRIRTHRVSERSFEDTLQHLEWGFGGYGITVVARLDHRSLLDEDQGSIRKSGMFLIMRQAWGKFIFENDPTAVLDMPLRVHVYEEETGETVVSYYLPSSVFEAHRNDGLTAMGEELDAMLKAIVHVATKKSGLEEDSVTRNSQKLN
jgi:uncharacterized protein (DUF302 family)